MRRALRCECTSNHQSMRVDTDLVGRQSDSAGHVPGEREHDGHEVGDKWFVSASFLFTQDVNLENE